MPICNICKRSLDAPGDDTTLDCGGDCLWCMAEAGDPECIAHMDQIDPDWREKDR